MTRVRLLVAGTAVLLLGAAPAGAAETAGHEGGAVSSGEGEALVLLAGAVQAVRVRAFSGTQQVDTWHGATATSSVLEVHSDPGTSTSTVHAVPGTGPDPLAAPTPGLDERQLRLLAGRYALVVAGEGDCAGRPAQVVEARRPDGAVAGRFWLDRGSGLALRREVYDATGHPVLSTAFVSLQVAQPAAAPAVLVAAALPVGSQVALEPERPAGWAPPPVLPGGFVLAGVRRPVHDGVSVLHLAWSDGLSTVSVFSQPGALEPPRDAGFTAEQVDDTTVWVHRDAPERIVWGGAGQVFTLVSDAGHDDLLSVVGALPHDPDPDEGLRARLGRGLSRLSGWVDPSR